MRPHAGIRSLALTVLLAATLVAALITALAYQPAAAAPRLTLAEIETIHSGVISTTFTEVAAAVGITSTHPGGGPIPGQAWGDYNNDGWLDLYLTHPAGPNTLYQNNQDGTFSVSPYSAQVAVASQPSGGAVFGDYDNDGWVDLYVLNDGPNKLFHNDAGGGFTDVTTLSGTGENGFGQTGAWGDFDGDGFLDLYVNNWWCSTANCTNYSRDGLFHNNGDGTFTNIVTNTLPYTNTDKPTFVASFLDYDNDEDLDLYVVADKRYRNMLYRNDGPGCGEWCFTDVSVASGSDTSVDGMGLSVGDYDLDGDLDLFFSNADPPVLLQNQTSQGSPTFVDVTAAAGVNFNSISWGNVFFDYDNDGCPDIYLAIMNTTPGLENRLFHNECDGTFTDATVGSGVDNNGQSFGVAYGDYDNDGWLDLVVGNIVDRYYLYHNEGGTNQWLRVKLIGHHPINADAIGSRVYIELDDGRTLMQEVKSGSSLGAGNDTALHFGLGQANILNLTIRWSDGLTETFSSVTPNQVWRAHYPQNARYLPFIATP